MGHCAHYQIKKYNCKIYTESNGQDDVTKSGGETYILDSCSNFTQPKELYDYYQKL